jgi:hypothetical protein
MGKDPMPELSTWLRAIPRREWGRPVCVRNLGKLDQAPGGNQTQKQEPRKKRERGEKVKKKENGGEVMGRGVEVGGGIEVKSREDPQTYTK